MSYMFLFLFPLMKSGTNAHNGGRFLTKNVSFDFFYNQADANTTIYNTLQ